MEGNQLSFERKTMISPKNVALITYNAKQIKFSMDLYITLPYHTCSKIEDTSAGKANSIRRRTLRNVLRTAFHIQPCFLFLRDYGVCCVAFIVFKA